ncbi:MAG: preprotein translocase subunit YajC [Bacteroidetes bacterium]|nr:preprotein translocase subunit YajC [Bacteroidales bacterium]NJO69761.1 preprotein translocase subunit YajC [Bacteroidota bacterium]
MNLLSIILMGNPQAGSNPLVSLLPLVLIIVVFYFFMIRPQVKRQKELTNYRNNLKKGEKIVTTGGIYGKIAEIEDTTIIIEVEDKMRLKIDKSAVLRDPSDLAQQK